jgi:hypothetical protein
MRRKDKWVTERTKIEHAKLPNKHKNGSCTGVQHTTLRFNFKKARRPKPGGAPVGAPGELRSARRSAWKGLASGHRISTTFNGQTHFKKIAGSKVLDEYYNTYLRK